jgi:hypothetical protein
MAVMATLIGGLVWAQEKAAQLDVDVDMNKGTDMSGNWMQSINLGNWRSSSHHSNCISCKRRK